MELAPADADRLGVADGDEVNVRSNGTSVKARVALKERIRPGAAFLIEGTAAENAERLQRGRDRGDREAVIPLADVNFTEATWVMVVKSIVIFLVVFLIVPVLTVVERKADRPLSEPLRPQPGRARRA